MHIKSGFKQAAVIATAAAIVTLTGCASQGMMRAQEVNVALRGYSEVPANTTTASGMATFRVNPDKTLSGLVQTSDVVGSAAHIHLGKAGSNGPVIVGLVQTGGSSFAVPSGAAFTDDQYRAFQAGETYVNVHSLGYPGGQIRGQLNPFSR